MPDGLFSGWHIAILVIVLVLLFGARRLPGAAQSLGQSMHIFKKSVQGLSSDDQDSAAIPPPGATLPAAAALDPTQRQLSDLAKQVVDLQRQAARAGQL